MIKKRGLIISIVIVLAIVWIVLFIRINKEFPSSNVCEYGINQTISYDGIEYEVLNVEKQRTEKSQNLWNDSITYTVTIRIKNNSNEDRKLEMSKFIFTRLDYANSSDLALYEEANPEGVFLDFEEGEEKIVKFPFLVTSNLFTKKQWENIEESDWKLLLNLYPDKVMIDLK